MPYGERTIGYVGEIGQLWCPTCAEQQGTAMLFDSIGARNCAVEDETCEGCGAPFAYSDSCGDYVALSQVRGRWVDPSDLLATAGKS